MAVIEALHPVIMSSDVEATVAFLARLGFAVAFRDDPDRTRYAGLRRDAVEIHVQWNDCSGFPAGSDRPTLRLRVDDVDAMAEELTRHGIDGIRPFASGWGTYEFHLQDHDRNGYQFYVDR